MSLKSFDLNNSDFNNILLKNLISWLDNNFYDDGGYFSVTDKVLHKVDHPEYPSDRVYGSDRKNWSWRDDVVVKVNGVVNSAYSIDYDNGLVIFNSSTNGTVTADYTYKHIYIVNGKDLNFKGTHGKFDVYEGTYRENSLQFPAIVIELGSSSSKPLEIGSYSRTVTKNILLNIYHRDEGVVNRISNILYNQVDSYIPLFNFDTAYAAGAYPIDFNGFLLNILGVHSYLVSNYPFTEAANNSVYIESTEDEGSKKLSNELFHNTVRWKVIGDLKMGIS